MHNINYLDLANEALPDDIYFNSKEVILQDHSGTLSLHITKKEGGGHYHQRSGPAEDLRAVSGTGYFHQRAVYQKRCDLVHREQYHQLAQQQNDDLHHQKAV